MDLTGTFLIAMPNLIDPNFYRAVVLILEHNDEGTLGLVLNRQSMLSTMALCQMQDMEWQGGDEQVRVGGPVQPNSIWILHGHAKEEFEGTHSICDGCSFSTSRAGLKHVASRLDGQRAIFGGYSGWGAGQLTEEIREGVWLTSSVVLDMVFDDDVDKMWERALRQVGIDPVSLVPSGGQIQ